jgi:hypothetical protein
MGHITIAGRYDARYRQTIAAAFWIVVGTVAVIALADVLTVLAVVLAIVATAWWIWRRRLVR